jgi:hypothetical protein
MNVNECEKKRGILLKEREDNDDDLRPERTKTVHLTEDEEREERYVRGV